MRARAIRPPTVPARAHSNSCWGKHKVLQILVNIVRNAKDSCDASGRTDKQVTVRVAACNRGVQIQVIDNGIGISGDKESSRKGLRPRKRGMESACTGVHLRRRY